MKSHSELKSYQKNLIQKILDTPRTGLFLDMGLGKTVITLTAISELLKKEEVTKVLVIAPLRVANSVWGAEISGWDHLQHLTFSVATGTPAKRLKALDADVDIVLTNVDSVVWLCETGKMSSFDMIVLDESSKFKNASSKRFKSLKQYTGAMKRVVLLTGTPAPEGAEDLWSQLYLLDSGERLFRKLYMFQQAFFRPVNCGMFTRFILNSSGYPRILERISDIVFSLTAEDVLQQNEILWKTVHTDLPAQVREVGNRLTRLHSAILPNTTTISVSNPAVLVNKLLQISNGAVYDEEGESHVLHTEKLDALRDIQEENPNENLLVAYIYKSDLFRLKKEFPEAVVLSETPDAEARWNRGEIPMLLAHPKSAAHGLNLQYGGSVCIWFGLTWSLEEWKQFNKRLARPGQKGVVRIIPILSKDSIDTKIYSALQTKDITQTEVIDSLNITRENQFRA